MDLVKIGKYIAKKRKTLGLTQAQVAEKLGMSDKSVSKWERGVCLPDVSVYMELCKILGITLNEFIAGEDLEGEEIVKQSEENLIRITKDSELGKRRLKRIIAVLLMAALLLTGILSAIIYIDRKMAVNYIEPLAKDSPEMKIAEVLSEEEGAHLYRYAADDSFSAMELILSVYREGKLESSETIGEALFDSEKENGGFIAVVPEFSDFRVKVIIAGNDVKHSRTIDILEGIDGREYYARASVEIEERSNIAQKEEKPLLALIYDKDDFSTGPVEDVGSNTFGSENDLIYCLSVRFK